MNIIDTHVHIWNKQVQLNDNISYVPNYNIGEEQLNQLSEKYNITNFILVQPSFIEVDNTFLIDFLKNNKNTRGIVNFDPNMTKEHYLDLVENNICGVRFNFVSNKNLQNKNISEFSEQLKILDTLNLIIELHEKTDKYFAIFEDLKNYKSPIIIDHMFLCNDIEKHNLKELINISKQMNVYIKISAPYRLSGNTTQIAQYIIDNMDNNRILWGSDFPHTRHETKTTYQDQIDFIKHLSIDNIDLILYKNAQKLFKL